MIVRCVTGKGITGTTRYVLGEGRGAGNDNLAPGEQSRVGWIGGTGFGFAIEDRDDFDLARRVMEFDALNQGSPTRKCEQDAVHLALSWRPGETPDRAEMEEAAFGALKAMGMENAKAVFVSHTDEDYAHLHIVASKINPDTNRAYDLKGNYLKLSKWAQQWEREHGGVVNLRREGANAVRDAIDSRDPGAVLEALTEQRATFTAADLERALAKQIEGELDRAQFAERIVSHPEAVRLRDGETARFTSQAALAAEQHVLRAADGLARDDRHELGDHGRAVLRQEKFATIRDDQLLAFNAATGAAGLALIDGKAGTGKSYTMAAIREAYEANGYRVIGLAPTNAVAEDMRRDGFQQSGTVHSELFALNNERTTWTNRTVVMVDEAAMLDTKLMAMVTAHAQDAGAKLILVGDDRQLASIDRGGMFGALKDRYGAAGLQFIDRQRDRDDRRAAELLAEGNFSSALELYQAKGGIQWTRTQSEARAALVAQWAKDTAAQPDRSRFVFAYTNADVAQLNAALRAVRQERGELGPDHSLPTKDGEQPFAAGDRLQLTSTDKKRDLINGAVGTVLQIEGSSLTVQFDGRKGAITTFDAQEFGAFRHGYAGTIYKGQGRTLDQTYLYHSEQWRSAASYVALTRHRDKAALFVATNTARDVTQLARQMARVDDRRAAVQFLAEQAPTPVRPLTPKELAAELGGFGRKGEPEPQTRPHVIRPRVATPHAGMVPQQGEALRRIGQPPPPPNPNADLATIQAHAGEVAKNRKHQAANQPRDPASADPERKNRRKMAIGGEMTEARAERLRKMLQSDGKELERAPGQDHSRHRGRTR